MKKKVIVMKEEESDAYREGQSQQPLSRGNGKFISNQQYQCGDSSCGKLYHSYTAFYNHCKKSHDGQFPKDSLFNDKPFEGPTKNRGRPRIKKNEAKDTIQIESMKKENQLIEFLGTLKTKKAEELIVYVECPLDRVDNAVVQVKEWLRERKQLSQAYSDYLLELQRFNRIIHDNDLPEFYDPIESEQYPDKLDSYSFGSVYNYMTRRDMREKYRIRYEGQQLLFKIFLCWLARLLSQRLYNEVLYVVLQVEMKLLLEPEYAVKNIVLNEKPLLSEKGNILKRMMLLFFQFFMKEHEVARRLKDPQQQNKQQPQQQPQQPPQQQPQQQQQNHHQLNHHHQHNHYENNQARNPSQLQQPQQSLTTLQMNTANIAIVAANTMNIKQQSQSQSQLIVQPQPRKQPHVNDKHFAEDD